MRNPLIRCSLTLVGAASIVAAAGFAHELSPRDPPPVGTTILDFYGPGSQEGQINAPLAEATQCAVCHGNYDAATEPYRPWAASMMGQGARDPLFYAALAVSEQLAPGVGDFCIRCHTPRGWIAGHSSPTDGSGLEGADFEGISCSVCHRMVDPMSTTDQDVLSEIADVPSTLHSARYVIDQEDRRRGPFVMAPNFSWHQWLQRPFFQESRMCATCHDVTNPVFTMQPDGRYVLNDLDAPHPSEDPYLGFPLERTYSEWSQSEFARNPINTSGRFGGNRTSVSSCQDCHMPTTTGTACRPGLGGITRTDMPLHDFRGATTWMLKAVRNLYPDSQTGLSEADVNAAISRNQDFLARASDLTVRTSGPHIITRIINESGHKIPTGHLEGRRIWINVRFSDASNTLVREHGAYDAAEAHLDAGSTKVYEAVVGLDHDLAAVLGEPAGPSHLFPLNNKFYKDNRIPPRGFTNSGFAEIQCAPVGAFYADGQHWDDTSFFVPTGAVHAEISVLYQGTTREGVEGLRDANHTNTAGQTLYDQWVATGKAAPVLMDHLSLDLTHLCRADWNGVDDLDSQDYFDFLESFFLGGDADFNGTDGTDSQDYFDFIEAFLSGCP